MIHRIHELVWGPWLLVLFLGIGIIYTVKSGFFQIRRLPYWWKMTIGSIREEELEEEGAVTKFQTACTALAATIGTGNIVGVATALTAGGPGALFWMWVSAAIGMMTGYAETMLGIRYRYRDKKGKWICGPMVYLERGMHMPWLGMLYSFFCVMVSLGMGSMDFWRNRHDRHGFRTAGSHFSRDLHAVFHGGHHVVLRPDPRYFRFDFSRCAEAWSGCIRGCGIWNLQEPSVWHVQRRVLQ